MSPGNSGRAVEGTQPRLFAAKTAPVHLTSVRRATGRAVRGSSLVLHEIGDGVSVRVAFTARREHCHLRERHRGERGDDYGEEMNSITAILSRVGGSFKN
jgi:hypothetical protein